MVNYLILLAAVVVVLFPPLWDALGAVAGLISRFVAAVGSGGP